MFRVLQHYRKIIQPCRECDWGSMRQTISLPFWTEQNWVRNKVPLSDGIDLGDIRSRFRMPHDKRYLCETVTESQLFSESPGLAGGWTGRIHTCGEMAERFVIVNHYWGALLLTVRKSNGIVIYRFFKSCPKWQLVKLLWLLGQIYSD